MPSTVFSGDFRAICTGSPNMAPPFQALAPSGLPARVKLMLLRRTTDRYRQQASQWPPCQQAHEHTHGAYEKFSTILPTPFSRARRTIPWPTTRSMSPNPTLLSITTRSQFILHLDIITTVSRAPRHVSGIKTPYRQRNVLLKHDKGGKQLIRENLHMTFPSRIQRTR